MHRLSLALFLLVSSSSTLIAQSPTPTPSIPAPAHRLTIHAKAPAYFDGATVTCSADPGLAVEGTHRLVTKVERSAFELCLPGTTLPAKVTVSWSPRIAQTFALNHQDLAKGVATNPDGARQIKLTFVRDRVTLASGTEGAPAGEIAHAGRFGGRAGATPDRATEAVRATRASLARGPVWLVGQQNDDGGFGAGDGSERCLTTAAACLSLIAGGNTWKSGPQAGPLRRGLCWLVAQTDPKSGRVRPASKVAPLEEQALLALTLCEVFTLSRFEPLRESTLLATNALETMLDDPAVSDRRDACALGFTALALVSAKQTDLAVPQSTLAQAIVDLERATATGSPLCDAVAMLTGFFVGDPVLTAVDRRAPNLLANLPKRGATLETAYVYFGTFAMYQAGEPSWSQWSAALPSSLLPEQVQSGDLAGSWPPGDPRAQMRGRAWTTAMRLLTIATFDRFAHVVERK